MIRFRFTIYKNSILASLCNVFGTIFSISGIIVLISEDFMEGITLTIWGLLHIWWAASISKKKQFKQFVKFLQQNDIDSQMITSSNLCFEIYNKMPDKRTLKYIASLNPQAASQIQAMITKQK